MAKRTTVLEDWKDVNNLVLRYGSFDAAIKAIQREITEETEGLKVEAVKKTTKLEKKIQRIGELVEAFTKVRRDELPRNKKSFNLSSGKVGWRKRQASVSVRGPERGVALDLVAAGLGHLVISRRVTVTKIDKEKIKNLISEGENLDLIKRIRRIKGLKIVCEGEKFYIEPDEAKVKALQREK